MSITVEANLGPGCRVRQELGGLPCIFGAAGTLGMSADEAARRRVLEIPIVQKKLPGLAKVPLADDLYISPKVG